MENFLVHLKVFMISFRLVSFSGCSVKISGSVKNWKFSWPRSLAKFQILTNFSRLSFRVFSPLFLEVRLIFVKNWKFSTTVSKWHFSRLSVFSQNVHLNLISGSLRLSQNFVKNWKFSWPRSLAKFQILTNFSRLSFQTCEWHCKSQNGILECSLVIWMISGSLRLSQNFVKNWKFSWPRSLAKFQILTNFSRLSFQPC